MKTSNKGCIVCGFTKGLQTHHLNYDHSDDFPLNLEPVCTYCHSLAHYMKKDHFDRMLSRARVDRNYKATLCRIAEESYRENRDY